MWSLPHRGRRSGFVDADMVESTEGSMRARRAGVALGERRRAEESREGKRGFGKGRDSGSLRGRGTFATNLPFVYLTHCLAITHLKK